MLSLSFHSANVSLPPTKSHKNKSVKSVKSVILQLAIKIVFLL